MGKALLHSLRLEVWEVASAEEGGGGDDEDRGVAAVSPLQVEVAESLLGENQSGDGSFHGVLLPV